VAVGDAEKTADVEEFVAKVGVVEMDELVVGEGREVGGGKVDVDVGGGGDEGEGADGGFGELVALHAK
jgi:hypothetical protein